jgi:hypothetical protein
VLNRSHMHGILHGSTSPQPAVDPGRSDLGVCVYKPFRSLVPSHYVLAVENL